MKDGVAGAHCRPRVPERFPREANSRLDRGLIHLDPDLPIRGGSRNQESSRCKIKVRLAVLCFRDGRYEGPRQAEVQCQIGGCPPIILNVGAKHLPAPASGCALKGLIVKSQIRKSQQEVGHIVPAGKILGLPDRSEEHTSELQSRQYLVCRLLLEKKNKQNIKKIT